MKSRVALLKELSIPEFELLGNLFLIAPMHQFMAKMKCSKLHWLKQNQKNYTFYTIELAVDAAIPYPVGYIYPDGIYLFKVNNRNTITMLVKSIQS